MVLAGVGSAWGLNPRVLRALILVVASSFVCGCIASSFCQTNKKTETRMDDSLTSSSNLPGSAAWAVALQFLSILDNVQNAFFSSCLSYATLQLAKCSRWTGTLHAIWNQLKINSQLLQLSVSLCFIHFSETSVASGIFFGMRNTCTERLAWAWGGLKHKHFS